MKRSISYIILGLAALFGSLSAAAQNGGRLSAEGRTADPEGKAVSFATVILIQKSDSTRTYGSPSDENGHFSIRAPRGDYRLKASFLGYEPLTREISLNENTDLGDLVLQPSAIGIEAVEVKADLITREADRFVVNVANTPLAIGQTAKEMLQISPGVWVDERTGISINGKSNTQVIVNERPVRERGEDLINYLNSIKAEDILKIEVIPMPGSEYDASAQGGIVKITLKRQRNNGIEGSVSMRYGTSLSNRSMEYIQPGFNFNFKADKVSFYTTINENRNHGTTENRSTMTFLDGNTPTGTRTTTAPRTYRGDNPTLRIGTIYDFNDKHSVGVEANLMGFFPYKSHQDQRIVNKGSLDNSISNTRMEGYSKYKRWNISGNYIAKLDTVGSVFKLLLDYAQVRPYSANTYDSRRTGDFPHDSLYHYYVQGTQNLYSVTGDFDIKVGPSGRIKTGLKYSLSDVKSDQMYEYFKNDLWHGIDELNYENIYRENIGALYASYSHRFKNKISFIVGLRGEYTYAEPKNSLLEQQDLNIDKQDYFSLFPNANLSIPLNKKESQTLILAYNRRIWRPSFFLLIPLRQTNTDQSYWIGNPKLKPSYTHDLSLSWVIAKKYNVTVGANFIRDNVTSVESLDPDNPNLIMTRPENLKNTEMYYISVNLPAQITKWWRLSANLNGSTNSYEIGDQDKSFFSFRGNLSNNFTLNKVFGLWLTGEYYGPYQWGYTKSRGVYQINGGMTVSLMKNKIRGNIYVNNIFDTYKWKSIVNNPAFYSDNIWLGSPPRLGVAISYNFKSGKEFRAKKVESGAGAEGSRMQGQQTQ